MSLIPKSISKNPKLPDLSGVGRGCVEGLCGHFNTTEPKWKPRSLMFCEHAYEVPQSCPCDDECACRCFGMTCWRDPLSVFHVPAEPVSEDKGCDCDACEGRDMMDYMDDSHLEDCDAREADDVHGRWWQTIEPEWFRVKDPDYGPFGFFYFRRFGPFDVTISPLDRSKDGKTRSWEIRYGDLSGSTTGEHRETSKGSLWWAKLRARTFVLTELRSLATRVACLED